jgi:lipopolysaccharide export system protein LptC
MKTEQHIFALTKSEQRVVVLILLVLLAITIARHYREKQSHISTPVSATTQPSESPSSSPIEED